MDTAECSCPISQPVQTKCQVVPWQMSCDIEHKDTRMRCACRFIFLSSLAGICTALHSDLLLEVMDILLSTRTNQIGPPGISLAARRAYHGTDKFLVDGFR